MNREQKLREALIVALPVMLRADQLDGMYSHEVEIEAVKKALSAEPEQVACPTGCAVNALVRLTDDEVESTFFAVPAFARWVFTAPQKEFANAIQAAMGAKQPAPDASGIEAALTRFLDEGADLEPQKRYLWQEGRAALADYRATLAKHGGGA